MTDLLGGRLKAVLSCGAAASALIAGAGAQDTVIDTATTQPVATSTGGNVTISAGGSITQATPTGPAILIDADGNVTVEDGTAEDVFEIDFGTEGESDVAGVSGIAVRGDVAGTVEVDGDIRLLSTTERLEGALPPVFPENRFGFLIEQDARLTGDVTFGESASITLETLGGAGIGILGDLDGDLTAGGVIGVRGDDAAGLRVAGNVTGDVRVASGSNAVIGVAGRNAVGVDVTGDVGGTLEVGLAVRSSAFTDVAGLPDLPEGQTPLTVGQQDALIGGSALRVTGDVGGGIQLGRGRNARDADEANGITALDARATSDLTTDGAAPAVLIGGGATVGTLAEAEDLSERGFAGFGLYNGGRIDSTVARGDVDAVALRVDDAVIEGGLFNDSGRSEATGIRATATGDAASATAILLMENADLGRVLNRGTISAIATSDTGDAVAIRDLSGTLSSIVNEGTISAAVTNFAGQRRDADGNLVTETRRDGENGEGDIILDDNGDPVQFPVLDADEPTNRAIALDLRASTSGVTVENTSTGRIAGDVLLSDAADTLRADGGGTLVANVFDMVGVLETGGGDDEIVFTNGAQIALFAELGDGRDTLTVSDRSLYRGSVDFGGGGGRLTVDGGARLSAALGGADDVDVLVGADDSQLDVLGAATIGSLTTLAGAETTDTDGTVTTEGGAVLAFAVDASGQALSSLDVLGDANIADDTTFRTIFLTAFDEDFTAPIVTAGGTLTFDFDAADRLEAANVVPFLFEQSLSQSDDGRSILLSLRRREADELGIDDGLAPAFEPFIAALTRANTAILDADGEVVSAADTEIGRAVFNLNATTRPDGTSLQTSQERFLDAYDQFLPGPLDAPLTYARTQTDSVTSLVTQRVTRLRDGTTRDRNAWLQESSYFVDRSGKDGARGYDGGGFAIALGLDTPLGPVDTVGISAAVASARYDEETGEDFPFDRLTYTVGAYAAESLGDFQVDGRVAYGWASSESERNVVIVARDEDTGRATGEGDIRRTANGEWDGTQLSAYGRALYAGRVGAWDVQPFASLDYLKLDEDAYQETGEDVRAVAFRVAKREAESLRGNAGLIVGREFKTRPSRFDTSIPATIAPRVTLAYSNELSGDDLEGIYRFENGEDFVLTQEKPGGAISIGGDILYENEYARLGAGGSVTALDDTQVYSLRIGVGLKW